MPSIIPSLTLWVLRLLVGIDYSGATWPRLNSSRWLRIVQTSPFLRKWFNLGLDEDDLLTLELEIMKGPDLCPIFKGTGEVRNVRFARAGTGRGKSGAHRVCFAYFSRRGLVFLLTAFGKNEQANLTGAQKNAIARVIQEIDRSIEEGEIR